MVAPILVKIIVRHPRDWCMFLISCSVTWAVFGLSPGAVPARPWRAPGGGRDRRQDLLLLLLLLLLKSWCSAAREMGSRACPAMEPTFHNGPVAKKAESLKPREDMSQGFRELPSLLSWLFFSSFSSLNPLYAPSMLKELLSLR